MCPDQLEVNFTLLWVFNSLFLALKSDFKNKSETSSLPFFFLLLIPEQRPPPFLLVYLYNFWHICPMLDASCRSTDVVMKNKEEVRKSHCFAMLISTNLQRYALYFFLAEGTSSWGLNSYQEMGCSV